MLNPPCPFLFIASNSYQQNKSYLMEAVLVEPVIEDFIPKKIKEGSCLKGGK
jgi:hypothetical protein